MIYVGDETRDMEAARDSGVTAVAVFWRMNERKAMEIEGPEFCIDFPSELLGCAEAFKADFS